MVQAIVISFPSASIATTGPLEATPGTSRVRSLLRVNIVTPGRLQVIHRFTPGGYLLNVNQALHITQLICACQILWLNAIHARYSQILEHYHINSNGDQQQLIKIFVFDVLSIKLKYVY